MVQQFKIFDTRSTINKLKCLFAVLLFLCNNVARKGDNMLTILNDNQVEEFGRATGIEAKKIFISRNNRYYYVIIVDYDLKLRISKDLANKFI